MRNALLKTLGISTATAALALFAYGASAQDMKKKEPAKKMAACTSLKDETACTARDDCTWAAEVKDKKGKVKTKASCKVKPKPKAPAKKK